MHGQTKAKRYRRKSRLSRRRRGGMPSQAEVTSALAALEKVTVLCNPAALDKIAIIKAVLESVYPQQPAPVAQASAARRNESLYSSTPRVLPAHYASSSQGDGELGYLRFNMGSSDPNSENSANWIG